MKKSQLILLIIIFVLISVVFIFQLDEEKLVTPIPEPLPEAEVVNNDTANLWSGEATERYSAQVDRVEVVFEHKDFTQYRLKTNDLVWSGELNTERGYKEDIDATVFVLNWQQPEAEQIRYVRLTAEPTYLYMLDSNQEIIRGSKLLLTK